MKFFKKIKKFLNAKKLKIYLKTNHIPLFKTVALELNSFCNRDCLFCPRINDTTGKRKNSDGSKTKIYMPTKHVIRILNEIKNLHFQGDITFHHLSEPFNDDRLIKVAHEAKKRGMHPVVNTNGDFLINNDSLSKKAAEAFKSINVGLYDCHTEKEITETKNFWNNRLKGTKVTFSMAAQHPCKRPYVSKAIKAKPDASKAIKAKPVHQTVCLQSSHILIIHYDGTMALCCQDYKEEFSLGNAFEMSIKDLWFSKKHVRIIKDLYEGKLDKYPLCLLCRDLWKII